MKIHLIASQPHYYDHLMAIWKNLPVELRGQRAQGNHARLRDLASDDFVMVAGASDIDRARRAKIIMVEHGAGQRYVDIPPVLAANYGGPWADNVVAYLGPRQELVDATGLPGFAMGAPICDIYELFGDDRTAVITFHWRARRVTPEADSALHHYIHDLPAIVATLRARGFEVLGHRHPRLNQPVNLWSRIGVPEVDAQTARIRASLLIADNTSLMTEMAYSCRSVIALNAPWYRRDVEHGLRFWEYTSGPMADSPDELISMIDAYDDLALQMEHLRVNTAQGVYGKNMNGGHDGLRAAAWIAAFTAEWVGA